MAEEIQTAETNEQIEGSNADTPIETNDVQFADGNEGETNTKTETVKPTQTKEQNAEYARQRRERETQKKVDEARIAGIIEALGGVNPYTNEPVKDSTDVDEFLLMRKIEQDGGDPRADFAKYSKQREREKAEKAQQEKEQQEWYSNDKKDFESKYPDVSLNELVKDEMFTAFAEGKIGTKPLAEIYKAYTGFKSQYETKAKQKTLQAIANKQASVGSLTASNGNNEVFFTREQVAKMTQEEVKKNYETIRKSMQKW